MAAPLSIPLTFRDVENPDMLREDLERLAAAVYAYSQGLTGQQHAAVVQRRLIMGTTGAEKVSFGEVAIVSLTDGAVLNIQLPRPDIRNAGLLIGVRREATTGTIHLSSPGALVNGYSSVAVINEIGLVLGMFDGADYYFPPGTVSGDGLGV